MVVVVCNLILGKLSTALYYLGQIVDDRQDEDCRLPSKYVSIVRYLLFACAIKVREQEARTGKKTVLENATMLAKLKKLNEHVGIESINWQELGEEGLCVFLDAVIEQTSKKVIRGDKTLNERLHYRQHAMKLMELKVSVLGILRNDDDKFNLSGFLSACCDYIDSFTDYLQTLPWKATTASLENLTDTMGLIESLRTFLFYYAHLESQSELPILSFTLVSLLGTSISVIRTARSFLQRTESEGMLKRFKVDDLEQSLIQHLKKSIALRLDLCTDCISDLHDRLNAIGAPSEEDSEEYRETQVLEEEVLGLFRRTCTHL